MKLEKDNASDTSDTEGDILVREKNTLLCFLLFPRTSLIAFSWGKWNVIQKKKIPLP